MRKRGGRPGWGRRATFVFTCLALTVLVLPAFPVGAATTGSGAKVDSAVRDRIQTSGVADFWVELSATADLGGASQIGDWAERGRWVVDRLRAVATTSQAGVVADLKDRGAAYTPFWVDNRVFVKGGNQAALDSLAGRSEVARISASRSLAIPEEELNTGPAPNDFVEWNVVDIGADQVWNEFGVRGEGVVVGSIDTGVQFDHPALVNQYRGRKPDGTFDHNYNWFDPDRLCTASGSRPCDAQGHGTHVMGTAVGDGGEENHIGVAPGAKWITAGVCGPETCSDFAVLSAGQWMLAPTDLKGNNPDPARRPQVVNFSLQNPDGSNTFFRPMVRAWLASGQFGSFANGDSLASCGTVASPASLPEAYGANPYNRDHFAGGAQGPSPVDGSIKPNISAPGFFIWSSEPGGYGIRGGSSMAAAHVSGAAALLLSASPDLAGDVPGTRALLDESAIDEPDLTGCGGTLDRNNQWGEGRLDALGAVRRAAGEDATTLTGRVTDVVSGDPIAGATVATDTDHQTATTADGTYHLFLEPGEHEATASAYGYDSSAPFGLTASPGAEITHDFALTPQSATTISGTVTDGGGHGWPLAARIDIEGFPDSPIFTDPATGAYSVDLKGGSHEFTVSAELGGYEPEIRQVSVPPDPATQDFELIPDSTCSAPGYHVAGGGLFETFDAGLPAGWQVVDNSDGGEWRFDDPGGRINLTGGEGPFAIVDSDFYGFGVVQDTELISPVVDLSTAATPEIRFATHILNFTDEIFDVDLSIDGGASWTTVWHRTGEDGPYQNSEETIPIPSAAGQPDVRVRFHYHNADFEWWWQVDNVLIGGGACAEDPGGLVAGFVTDAVTGDPLQGAEVAGPGGEPSTLSRRRGTYVLFSPASSRSFTASRAGFVSETHSVTVTADAAVRRDFALDSGRLVFEPDEIEEDVDPGGSKTVDLQVTNDGTAEASFQLNINDRGSESQTEPASSSPPVKRKPVKDFNPGWIDPRTAAGAEPASEPEAAEAPGWSRVAPYRVRIFDHAAAFGEGKVYSVGGISGEQDIDDLFIYDVETDDWEAGPEMRYGRTRPGAAFIDGRLYVVGGWDTAGRPIRKVEVYDPLTRQWSAAADMPAARSSAGVAVLDGKLYVVGGCASGGCGPNDGAYRYDPDSDSWEALTPYPFDVAHPACGAVSGAVYCAGGFDGALDAVDQVFAYDESSGTWQGQSPLPFALGLAAYTVANDRLVLVGGVDEDNFSVDATLVYDASADEWSFEAPRPNAAYRGAAACGVYSMGGISTEFPFPRVRFVEHLEGFDQCGEEEVGPFWLSLDRTSGTLAPGESTVIQVELDAGTRTFATYFAVVGVQDDTPRIVQPIRVAMDIVPPASWGRVEGVVTGLGRCDTPGSPLKRAGVRAAGSASDQSMVVGADGRYSLGADGTAGPVAVSAQFPGYLTKTLQTPVSPGQTTNLDLSLSLDRPCVTSEPERLEVSVAQGATTTSSLTLENRGSKPADIRIGETAFALDPVAASNAVGPNSPAGRLANRSRPQPSGAAPTWFQGKPAFGFLYSYGSAQCEGDPNRFYVISGVTQGVSHDSLARYDSTDNSWVELAPLPQDQWPEDAGSFGVYFSTAVCEAGKIHLLGGFHQFETQDTHFVYDIGADKWSMGAPVPRKVQGAAAASWNGKIYLAGGAFQSSDATTDEVDVYDPATDSWSVLPARMPLRTEQAAFVQAGRYLYVAGGKDDFEFPVSYKQTQRLDLVTGIWTLGPLLPREVDFTAMAATDKAIYTISGWTRQSNGSATTTDKVLRLETAAWPGGSWTQVNPLTPFAAGNTRGFCTEGATGGEISMVGGFGLQFVHSELIMRTVAPERCPTIRSNVDWLAVDSVTSTVAAGGTRTINVQVDASMLTPGEHSATLLVETTDAGAPEIRVPVIVDVGAPQVTAYLSLAKGATVGGLAVADEDIVGLGTGGACTPYFDGSDVGVGGLVLDAFARLTDGSLVMSFKAAGAVPGVAGTVDDSDLVRFLPTTLGATTAGTFEMWFDGSDVGLTTSGENVDSVEVLGDGRIVLSTTGDPKVTGVTAADEDLLIFAPATLGATTAGTFALWFDGSDVGMSASSEDTDAAAFRSDGKILLSTTGNLSVAGLTAGKEDVVVFSPSQLGPSTTGSFAPAPLVDGSTVGLGGKDISGVELQ